MHTVHGSVARGDASEMPPLLATGEAAALALAAAYKRVRVHERVASLSRTVRARTHVRVICSTKSALLFVIFLFPPSCAPHV